MQYACDVTLVVEDVEQEVIAEGHRLMPCLEARVHVVARPVRVLLTKGSKGCEYRDSAALNLDFIRS